MAVDCHPANDGAGLLSGRPSLPPNADRNRREAERSIWISPTAGGPMSSAESAAADALPLPASPGSDPAGFWLGLWQGFISPITFLISLFTSAVNIYEVQNNGNWYDFGFMLGVAAAFGGGAGGGSASAGRVRRRRRASDN